MTNTCSGFQTTAFEAAGLEWALAPLGEDISENPLLGRRARTTAQRAHNRLHEHKEVFPLQESLHLESEGSPTVQ